MIWFHANHSVLKTVAAGSLLLGLPIALQAQSSLPRSVVELRPQPGVSYGRDHQPTTAAINKKLANIIIPAIEFRSTTLADAIEFLRQESSRLDNDPNPDARGVNILLNLPPAGTAAARPAAAVIDNSMPGLPPDPSTAPAVAAAPALPPPTAKTRITLNLNRIPLLEALKYVASQAGLKVKVEPYAVSLVPLTEVTDTMVTAVFNVPPNLINNVSNVGGHSLLDEPATAAH